MLTISAFASFNTFAAPESPADDAEVVEAEATTKECPFCCSTIAINAKRCPNCTSELG